MASSRAAEPFDSRDEWPMSEAGGVPKPLAWSATQRYGVTPAAGTLGLVHDFLNTRGRVDDEPDWLSRRDTAQQWADEAFEKWSSLTRRVAIPFRLDDDVLPRLRDLRDMLATTNGFRAAADRASSFIALTVDGGEIAWQPAGAGGQRLVSAIMAEVLISQHRGTWTKLRQCRDISCAVTFYDRTWNQRQLWHDTADLTSSRHPVSTSGALR